MKTLISIVFTLVLIIIGYMAAETVYQVVNKVNAVKHTIEEGLSHGNQ